MCGVVAVFNEDHAAEKLFLGLFALQHRGQDNAGMATASSSGIKILKDKGLVADVFKPQVLAELGGNIGIGHTRYPTAGDSSVVNAQPHYADTSRGRMVLVSNGDVTNMFEQTRFLKKKGFTPYSSNDAEVIVASIACYYEETKNIKTAIKKMASNVKGSYSAALIFQNKLYVFRDAFGIRPLYLGRKDGGYVAASETCAIETMGYQPEREVVPGELLTIDGSGINSAAIAPKQAPSHCVFELIYFSRPDSVVFGKSTEEQRFRFGRELAKEAPAEADFVTPIPDSSNAAAMGYASQLGLPFRQALIRSHYVGRTFIGPNQSVRDLNVILKFNPVRSLLDGKRVVVVDDSIVRGTTSQKIMRMLKEAGATKVHLRIASPPIRHSCHYGIDTPRHRELIATNYSKEGLEDGLTRYLGVDSLKYLSLKGLKESTGNGKDYCYACINGIYPIRPSR